MVFYHLKLCCLFLEFLFCSLPNCAPSVSYVPAWSTCPHAHVLTCQKRANFSFLRASVTTNVRKACQFFNQACQLVKRRAIFSTSPAKTHANFSTIFQKNILFFIYQIYLYLISFICFVYFKYIPNIYLLYNFFFFYLTLYAVCIKTYLEKHTSCHSHKK